jgi:hypothetical protein
MSPKAKISIAEAAAILHCYESEVASVDQAAEGLVATTTDGQRYVLDGDAYTWLKPPLNAPQIFHRPEQASAATASAAPLAGDQAVAKPVEKMSVRELKALAASLGIDLGAATKKADIAALLTQSVAEVVDQQGVTHTGVLPVGAAVDDGDGDE